MPDLQLIPKPIAHLPLIRAILDKLQIPQLLDQLLPPDPRNLASDAECVVVMLLNILQGRVALYNMDAWLDHTDVALLLGEDVQAAWFSDARLGACLDHIAAFGTERVLSSVVAAYLARPETPREYTIHHDGTSISLQGAYEGAVGRALPAHGHSKDLRPDLLSSTACPSSDTGRSPWSPRCSRGTPPRAR